MSRIRLYIEDTDEVSLSQLQAFTQKNGLAVEITPMAQTDWSESWKENYPPQEVGEKLIVLPYWLDREEAGGRIPVILNPGLTFGTGAHPSTQMVMEELEQRMTLGASCLDLGSGSGILSIAALRLGASRAVGVDIDPKAEDAARENAEYNGYSAPQATFITGNVTADPAMMESLASQHFDVVLVNIVADVIISLCPVLPRFLEKDSVLILSGILDTRLEDVRRALAQAGLTECNVRHSGQWCCVTAKEGAK